MLSWVIDNEPVVGIEFRIKKAVLDSLYPVNDGSTTVNL